MLPTAKVVAIALNEQLNPVLSIGGSAITSTMRANDHMSGNLPRMKTEGNRHHVDVLTTGGLTATNYTNPTQLGKFAAFSATDWALYAAKQVCKAAGF